MFVAKGSTRQDIQGHMGLEQRPMSPEGSSTVQAPGVDRGVLSGDPDSGLGLSSQDTLESRMVLVDWFFRTPDTTALQCESNGCLHPLRPPNVQAPWKI